MRLITRKNGKIEGTLSQAIRRADLRFARFIGKAEARLQNIATGAAINLWHRTDFLCGHQPARTRITAFVKLAPT